MRPIDFKHIVRAVKKNESGMLVIEATYIFVITIFIIFLTFNAGVIMYNRMIITAVANEAAESVGMVYGSVGKDPYEAYVKPDFFKGRNVYRYLRISNDYIKDPAAAIAGGIISGDGAISELDRNAKDKLQWYAASLIYLNEMSTEHSMDFDSDVQVTVDRGYKTVYSPVITVSISREYEVLSLNPMAFFGLEPKYKTHAEASAICYDPIHQMNMMSFVDEVGGKLDSGMGDKAEKINHIAKVIKRIWDLATKTKGDSD